MTPLFSTCDSDDSESFAIAEPPSDLAIGSTVVPGLSDSSISSELLIDSIEGYESPTNFSEATNTTYESVPRRQGLELSE